MGERIERRGALELLIVLSNAALGLALLAALVWMGQKIHHALLVFTLGVLVAYALQPLVERLCTLTRGRVPHGVCVFLVLAAVAGIGILLVVLAAGPTTQQVREIGAQAPELRARTIALAADADHWLTRRHIPFRVANVVERLSVLAGKQSEALAHEGLRAAGEFAVGLIDTVLVLLVGIYFLVYSPELKKRVSRHVPFAYQPHFNGLLRDLNHILGGFIRGQLVMAAAMGVVAGLGCAVLQLPFSILLGLVIGLASLIPIVGAYIGALPAVLLALTDPVNPLMKLIWVVLLLFVVNEAGSKILYPRLVGSATGLHEVLVVFVLLAGAEVGGILGALLAVPITALAGLLAVYAYRVWKQGEQPTVPEPSPLVVDPSDRRGEGVKG